MLAAILRLLALRPLLSIVIFGFPLLLLVVVGLISIVLLKFLVFVVLPIGILVWVARKLFRSRDAA